MLNGLYSAAAGMIAQQTRIDALSNDIANVNTTGYKQVRTGFRDLVYNIEAGMRIGAGSAVVDAGRVFSQGGLQQSGDPLSVALDGPGFFQVKRGDGSLALTRSGDFHSDANGQLVTGQGDRRVAAGHASRRDEPRRCRRSRPTGVVVGEADGRRPDPGRSASPRPRTCCRSAARSSCPPTASGGARQMPTQSIRQGFLEASNVDLASAMVNVIDAQRSFQMDSKAIQTQDQLMQIANEIRRCDRPDRHQPPPARRAQGRARRPAALRRRARLRAAAHRSSSRSRSPTPRRPPAGRTTRTPATPTTSMYKQMLPDAMSQGVTAAGGLGLARRALRRSCRQRAGES